MQKTIIADTSCLILLEKIGELDLLHEVFGEILVTQEVADEYDLAFPNWIPGVRIKSDVLKNASPAGLI